MLFDNLWEYLKIIWRQTPLQAEDREKGGEAVQLCFKLLIDNCMQFVHWILNPETLSHKV